MSYNSFNKSEFETVNEITKLDLFQAKLLNMYTLPYSRIDLNTPKSIQYNRHVKEINGDVLPKAKEFIKEGYPHKIYPNLNLIIFGHDMKELEADCENLYEITKLTDDEKEDYIKEFGKIWSGNEYAVRRNGTIPMYKRNFHALIAEQMNLPKRGITTGYLNYYGFRLCVNLKDKESLVNLVHQLDEALELPEDWKAPHIRKSSVYIASDITTFNKGVLYRMSREALLGRTSFLHGVAPVLDVQGKLIEGSQGYIRSGRQDEDDEDFNYYHFKKEEDYLNISEKLENRTFRYQDLFLLLIPSEKALHQHMEIIMYQELFDDYPENAVRVDFAGIEFYAYQEDALDIIYNELVPRYMTSEETYANQISVTYTKEDDMTKLSRTKYLNWLTPLQYTVITKEPSIFK